MQEREKYKEIEKQQEEEVEEAEGRKSIIFYFVTNRISFHWKT